MTLLLCSRPEENDIVNVPSPGTDPYYDKHGAILYMPKYKMQSYGDTSDDEHMFFAREARCQLVAYISPEADQDRRWKRQVIVYTESGALPFIVPIRRGWLRGSLHLRACMIC